MMIYDKVDKWLSTLLYMHRDLLLEIEADALHGVGAHFAVSNRHVCGVRCIGFEGGGTFERGIKHHVAVR